MIKVKHLQSIEDLIAEAEIIRSNGGGPDQPTGDIGPGLGDRPEDAFEYLNQWLDYLMNLSADRIEALFKSMTYFKNTFGSKRFSMYISQTYIKQVKAAILDLRRRMSDEFDQVRLSSDEIQELSQRTIKFAARIEFIERVYRKFKELGEMTELSDSIINEIENLKRDLVENYVTPIVKGSERTKRAYEEFERAETGEESVNAAKNVFDSVNAAKAAAEDFPKEFQEGLDSVNSYYEKKVEEVVGKEVADQIKKEVYADKDSVTLLRDVFAYQYGSWSTKKQIVDEAHKLRTRVNDRKLISPEAKTWLIALIDGIEKDLITRLENKQFDTSKYKGIHYDFEKKLPLFEKTPLPVTGKQIADDSTIMKLRKGIQSLIDILGKAEGAQSKEERAWQETGKFLHEIYAKTLNGSAMAIGKALGGREGEMKADAITRMFIPNTKVVDKPATKAVNEEGVAPGGGTSPQVPGAIGGMGPIVAPTRTSIGSGDQFQSVKKKKKKSKKKNSFVMEFNEFLKNIK